MKYLPLYAAIAGSCSVMLFILLFFGCKSKTFRSPGHYDLAAPEKIQLPDALREISGIAFKPGDESNLYAIEDEHGRLYSVNLATKKITDSRFGSKADYEDLVFTGGRWYVLASNGTITAASFSGTTAVSKEYDGLIPPGEYEGISAQHDTLFVLCKHCSAVDAKDHIGIYLLKINSDTAILSAGVITPAISLHKKNGDSKKEKIYPAAMAKNPVDGNWYVLSGVNKMLLLFDPAFGYLGSYRLNPEIYEQPEGIAFSASGDMFICSEGHIGIPDILTITRKP